jgi:hypothetical protein
MFVRSAISALTVALGLSVTFGANALEVANGLSVNGTEKSAELSLKAIILQDDQVLIIR